MLVPTRELALQVADVLAPLARAQGLRVALVTGGMSYGPQIRAFATGTDIVVATPGRLIDLMEQGVADLGRVEITVLDEADHMADLGFLPAVTQILRAVPTGGQRLLFSATLDRAVDRLVRDHLVDPITHRVDPDQASITTMDHRLVEVAPTDKVGLTADLAGRAERTIVFVRTQRGADRVADQLRDAGVLAGALHGGLTQGARARILAAFKDGRLPVLVATDVAARGIHVDSVEPGPAGRSAERSQGVPAPRRSYGPGRRRRSGPDPGAPAATPRRAPVVDPGRGDRPEPCRAGATNSGWTRSVRGPGLMPAVTANRVRPVDRSARVRTGEPGLGAGRATRSHRPRARAR